MSTLSGSLKSTLVSRQQRSARLAAEMTHAASTQSYYTIRFLADRDRVADAYRAYAYFRWIDDRIDEGGGSAAERVAYLRRQQALVEAGYRGRMPGDLCPEEQLLADLIAGDKEPDSGLRTYLNNMMGVMAFDLERRGRLITADELDRYTDLLATAVAEALLYFIGHNCPAPDGPVRSLAVRGACVTHMLRDMIEDCAVGYFNIPAEYLAAHGISPDDRDHPAYRDWVAGRVALARDCFREGRAFIAQVGNARCRLAGRAYIARFEYVAGLIERDGYRLRESYPERKSPRAALWMAGRTIRN
jgi:phytoene/squalene synthetase